MAKVMKRQNERERIELVVSKVAKDDDFYIGKCCVVSTNDVRRLLRRELAKERARVRKVVKSLRAKCERGHFIEPHTKQTRNHCDAYQLACTDLLATLSGRKG